MELASQDWITAYVKDYEERGAGSATGLPEPRGPPLGAGGCSSSALCDSPHKSCTVSKSLLVVLVSIQLQCVFTLTASWGHFILCQIYICWVVVTGPFTCPEATSLRCQEGLWDWLGDVCFTIFVLSPGWLFPADLSR